MTHRDNDGNDGKWVYFENFFIIRFRSALLDFVRRNIFTNTRFLQKQTGAKRETRGVCRSLRLLPSFPVTIQEKC